MGILEMLGGLVGCLIMNLTNSSESAQNLKEIYEHKETEYLIRKAKSNASFREKSVAIEVLRERGITSI